MEYCGKYDLKNHSTLKIGPVNAEVVYIDKKEDILEAVKKAEENNLISYPLGGGSNTIFSDEVSNGYLFLIPRMSEIKLSGENLIDKEREDVYVAIDAGLPWDEAVKQTVEMDLSGLEALSYIPGLTGASPVQNIGAYGTEVKDTIDTVHTFDIEEKKFVDFKNKECEFEYRNSLFKKNTGRYFIYSVTFKLSKAPPKVPQYKDVISYFENKKNTSPTLKEIREAIIYIRKNKLPDPKDTPNSGSYFKNPVVTEAQVKKLLEKFPEMPIFDYNPALSVIPCSPMSSLRMRGSMDSRIHENDTQEYKKLSAGWLIDKAGLKGFQKNNFSIHKNHALILTGNGKGTLSELMEFESYIKQKVFKMFGVELEREPVVIE